MKVELSKNPVLKGQRMTERCANSLLGAHNFQARYDKKFPNRGFKMDTFYGTVDDLKESTYVHDICVRCGKIITREAKQER